MAYFSDPQEQQHEQLFFEPVADEPDPQGEELPQPAAPGPFRRHRNPFLMASGAVDLLAIIACTLGILALVALLLSLLQWLRNDLLTAFPVLQ